jgi:quinol monooxygenase YgiN
MLIVHVQVVVKEESVPAFIEATRLNAAASRAEPGVLRFDLIQQDGSPNRFVLIEIYRDDDDAPAAHKATAHYAAWRDAVAPWMAEPRTSAKFRALDVA